MRASTTLLCIALLLVGCSDDDGATPESTTQHTVVPSTSTTTEPATTSTTAPTTEHDCSNRPAGSSTATFDPTAGTYAVQDVTLDVSTLSLGFNVVQWLSGEDAQLAWQHDHPDDPDGPPNDYYIVDESSRRRRASLSADAEVLLTHLRSDGTASVERDTIEGLGSYIDENATSDTYWLTFESGAITHVCEQYRP